jgi:dipeptide/tripeptide permease
MWNGKNINNAKKYTQNSLLSHSLISHYKHILRICAKNILITCNWITSLCLIPNICDRVHIDYPTNRVGSAENNSRNRCQNFREIIFSKNVFFVWWNQESSRIILFLAFAKTNFLKINKYSAWKCQPCPTGTVPSYGIKEFQVW